MNTETDNLISEEEEARQEYIARYKRIAQQLGKGLALQLNGLSYEKMREIKYHFNKGFYDEIEKQLNKKEIN